MSSSHELLVVVLLAACGNDRAPATSDDDACRASTLTYDNFAEPFLLDWCRGCHGSAIPEGMRQGAPIGLDFETRDQVVASSARIALRATTNPSTMPPQGGPSDEERAMLAEWIACGLR